MSDVYLIKKETLTAIADAIRRFTRTEQGYDIPQSITPETMPNHIEEYVADSNYDRGYSEGIRTLQGSFALKGYIEDFGMYGNYPCPSGIYTDFAYTNDDGEVVWAYEEIDHIEISDDFVDFYSISGWNKYNDYYAWYGQDDVMEGNLRHQYIDILEPVQVSQGLYEVLNNLISFDDYTPFDLGFDVGYNKGKEDGGVDLEALGELCEVVTMVDSAEELYVAIFNRHPTYYLHCTFNHTNLGSINVVVSPNGMESYTVWNIYKEFYIDNVRWKASAT